jgi:peroxiredoxin
MNRSRTLVRSFLAFATLLIAVFPALAQTKPLAYTDQEQAISQQLRKLRQMPDNERAVATTKLALDIRALPITMGKMRLANGLQNLSTEGDFGADTRQAVTDTLAAAIQEYERTGKPGDLPYEGVASMVRYQGAHTSLSGPKYEAAMAELEAADRTRETADFTLTDLQGRKWTLEDLKGKVVIVNFWATWCPPCRKEIPDLEKLYQEFNGKGLVILGVADDDVSKLKQFAAEQKMTYPILPDPGRKAHSAFRIEGIPATMIYDREGKLVAQAFDAHSYQQFSALLEKAGLK